MNLNLRRKSTVIVTGTFALGDKQTVFQEVTVEHDTGAPDSALIAQAYQLIRQTGGILVDSPDQMDYYPMIAFSKINFAVKKITLATTAGVTKFPAPH